MDLLFKRYANPFAIMDEMLSVGKMTDFIIHLVRQEQEEMQWDVWLHKIEGLGFEEYKAKLAEKNKSYAMSTKQVDATINKSKGILKRFKPA